MEGSRRITCVGRAIARNDLLNLKFEWALVGRGHRWIFRGQAVRSGGGSFRQDEFALTVIDITGYGANRLIIQMKDELPGPLDISPAVILNTTTIGNDRDFIPRPGLRGPDFCHLREDQRLLTE